MPNCGYNIRDSILGRPVKYLLGQYIYTFLAKGKIREFFYKSSRGITI